MTKPYDPAAVRAVLIAFEKCEETLKALRGSPDLPDDLRALLAEEILARVDQGELNAQKVTEAVLSKVRGHGDGVNSA